MINDNCCPPKPPAILTDVTLIDPNIIGEIGLDSDAIAGLVEDLSAGILGKLEDCNGNAISINSSVATCQNVSSSISSALVGYATVSSVSSISSSLSNKMSKTGDTATGKYVFDVTGVQTQSPYFAGILIRNTEQLNNTDPYSSILHIESTDPLFNQPHLKISKLTNTPSFGNSANLVLVNKGGGAVDIELIANDGTYTSTVAPFLNTVQGKFELGVVPGGGTAGVENTGRNGGGAFYVASRREDGSGFERWLNVYQLRKGGEIESRGNGLEINPIYNNTGCHLDLTNAFHQSTLLLQSTASVATNSNVFIDLWSNSAGTNTVGGKWRIISNGGDNRFSIRNYSAGNVTALEILDTTALGVTAFYQSDDVTAGRIRLGNSTYGMIIAGATNTYTFNSVSTSTYLRTNGNKYVSVIDTQAVAITDGGTLTVTPVNSEVHILINNGSAIASHTYVLPATPVPGQKVYFHTRQGSVSSLTFISADSTAVIYGTPTTHSAQSTIGYIYYAAGNSWYKTT